VKQYRVPTASEGRARALQAGGGSARSDAGTERGERARAVTRGTGRGASRRRLRVAGEGGARRHSTTPSQPRPLVPTPRVRRRSRAPLAPQHDAPTTHAHRPTAALCPPPRRRRLPGGGEGALGDGRGVARGPGVGRASGAEAGGPSRVVPWKDKMPRNGASHELKSRLKLKPQRRLTPNVSGRPGPVSSNGRTTQPAGALCVLT